MAIHINTLNGGEISVTLADGSDGNWKFSLGDFPETIEFFQFPGSQSCVYAQICPSQDETQLLIAFGNGDKAFIGTWSDFNPATFSKTAESTGIRAGSTLYTPDGIHYLTQNFNTTTVYMYVGTIPYDVATISNQPASYKGIPELANVNGSSISKDGLHLVCCAGKTLVSFDLSTPFDLSTANGMKQYYVGFPITEIFINQKNGRQILGVNTSNDSENGTISLITLGSEWDASSVVDVDSISPNIIVDGVTYTSDRFLRGVAVNNDGDKVVLIGTSMDKSTPRPATSKSYAALVDFN